MLYINFLCPPLPHFIVGGSASFRQGDQHERRIISNAFDLIFVYEGTLFIEENGNRFSVMAGQYLILPPGTLHKGSRGCECETLFYWLHFYTTGESSLTQDAPVFYTTGKISRSNYYKKDPFFVSLSQFGMVRGENAALLQAYMQRLTQVEIDRFQNEKRYNPFVVSQLEIQQTFLKVLSLICEQREQNIQDRDVAVSIYEYFLGHYREPFRLDNLARLYAFHRGHIIRCVKRKYGLSPRQLLLTIQMNKAQALLSSTRKPVKEVAGLVGFEDAAYFSKQFKKITGLTPAEYRRSPEPVQEGKE